MEDGAELLNDEDTMTSMILNYRKKLAQGEQRSHSHEMQECSTSEYDHGSSTPNHRFDEGEPVMMIKWRPPPKDWIKINVDVVAYRWISSFGIIARDSNGKCLRCIGDIMPPPCETAAEPQGLAVLQAIKLAVIEKWNNVVIEGEMFGSNIVERLLRLQQQSIEDCNDRLEVSNLNNMNRIVSECQSQSKLLENISFVYSPREANGAAHELACFARVNEFFIFSDFPDGPSCISSILISESCNNN